MLIGGGGHSFEMTLVTLPTISQVPLVAVLAEISASRLDIKININFTLTILFQTQLTLQ